MISFFCSFLFFAWQRGWIIINVNATPPDAHIVNTSLPTVIKKKVTLYYWHMGGWKKETTDLIWHEQKAITIEYLINSWLTLLDEEQLMEKKVTLQTVLLTQSDQAYLSFDRQPFSKESTTYEKWMWLEGLLKTIRDNGIKIQGIQFLVHHQPLKDTHLDFTNPWPLSGFMG